MSIPPPPTHPDEDNLLPMPVPAGTPLITGLELYEANLRAIGAHYRKCIDAEWLRELMEGYYTDAGYPRAGQPEPAFPIVMWRYVSERVVRCAVHLTPIEREVIDLDVRTFARLPRFSGLGSHSQI